MDHKTVCIIAIYFGKLPKYFKLWLRSCEYNPMISFLLVTDQELTKNKLPYNIRVIKHNIVSFKSLVEYKLGFSVSIDRPYKCCDYKPLLGFIFSEYITSYDYWGYCDLDLIFGDINYFLMKYDLKKYDRFLALGHLSIFRNNDKMKELFREPKGKYYYKNVLSSPENFAFDEMNGVVKTTIEKKIPFFTKRIFADIATPYNRFRLIEKYSLDSKPINYKKQLFIWDRGKVFRYYINRSNRIDKEEYMYIHFQKRPDFIIPFDEEKTDKFIICDVGFVRIENINKDLFSRYNVYPGKLFEYKEKFVWVCRKIRNRFF